MAAMAWNKVLLLLFFFAFLHLGLVFGESCRSYPADPGWKASLGEAERMAAQVRVMRSLRILSGAFTQGLRPLLTKPASGAVAEVQGVRMVVVKAEPADSREVFRVSVQLILGFWERFFSPVQLPGGRGPATRGTQDVTIAGEGTFHEGTGELCVLGCIGTVCKYKLKLVYPAPKTLRRVSTSGILSSTVDESDATFFDPVSIHAITDGPFQYTLNATVASECPKLPPDVSSGKLWHEEKVCRQGWASTHQVWSNQAFEVFWDCEGARCSPFEEFGKNGSSSSLRFDRIRCDGDRLQGLMLFTDVLSPIDRYADPASTDGILVAEGTWDSSTGRMCMIACRLYGREDCQIAVTVQFPLTFSVTQRSLVVGHIRSLRKETDAAYFKPVSFRQVSSGLQVTRFTSATSQPEYVYTKVDTAKTLCALGNKKPSPGKYPSGVDWRDLEFHGVKDKKSGSNRFVNLNLFTFGDQFRTYGQLHVTAANVTGLGAQGIMNVSYSIYYQIGASSESVMAGEGVYDPDTGSVCLIACQTANVKNAENLEQGKDCQIFFNVQLPPTDSQEVLKGSVRSLRLPADPLHFAQEKFSGTVHLQAVEAVWRIDLEIVLSVVMLSLTVVFIILQLVYSKQYPETLPYISTSMLLLLSLSHMIPLVLNFEALFQKKNDYQGIQRAAGWPEVNEVVVRLTTMTAMLLQLRLLQLVWKSRVRSRVTGEIDPAVQERRVLYTILPIYFLGGVIAVLSHALFGFRPYERQFLGRGNEGVLWWDIKAYGGLLLDFHLFPQVVGNVLWGAKEQPPLCKTFYFGMALVRSIPHLYDLCRKFKFIPALAGTYVYANPEWDFYSVTSDILIPLVTMLLAFMVYVQQRWGGRCVLPRRWRSRLEYEKVDVAPI